ncbi:MAG: ATP-binding cassette domain-containing protein [Patescibacteria group bacterium]|jgi:ABC-2 type transport system ATP-binding protein
MNQAIYAENLRKSFKGIEVLKGVDLAVERGTILALLGPNGAGKTTIIRILSTLLPDYAGKAAVNGFDVASHPQKVRKSIGLTGQYAAVDEYLNGLENLEMMGRLYHLNYNGAKKRAVELLEQFDLVDAQNRAVKTYSGGMRRRLDLALSLIAAPPVIFLDEPTTGLDPRSRMAMWEIIKKLVDSEATILLTTQYLEEADLLADKVAVLDEGKIIAEGAPEELKNLVGRERLKLTIGKKNDFEKIAQTIKGEGIQTNSEELSISLATDGSVPEIQRVLNYITQSGAEISSMSLDKPTMDDVFLHLTGRMAAEENNKANSQKNGR